MTAEMIDRARETAFKHGIENIEFRLGEIEHLPVRDAEVDVVISNCVINLSPDKPQVFREAHRALKPGGRMMVSDIVQLTPIPDSIKASIDAYVGCIAGASMKNEYLAAIEAAGFTDVVVQRETAFEAALPKNADPQLMIDVETVTLADVGLTRDDAHALSASMARISVLARKPL
jgi:SAM-dependent methyltransferase